MGFLEWLKNLFRRKQSEEAPAVTEIAPSAETYTEIKKEPEAEPKKPAFSEEREQKSCAKCGAPNDKFVHMCWLCKAEI